VGSLVGGRGRLSFKLIGEISFLTLEIGNCITKSVLPPLLEQGAVSQDPYCEEGERPCMYACVGGGVPTTF